MNNSMTKERVKDYKNLINGKMMATANMLEVINPATEKVIGRVPDCGQAELDQAVAAARGAFKSWSKTTLDERRVVLNKMADKIAEHHDELMRLLTAEQGKPHQQAGGEVASAAGMLRAIASMKLEDKITQDDETRHSRVRRIPIGVVGAIVPWNFPVVLAAQKIAPALLSGCTIVVKPSPFTPLATCRMAELFAEVAPAGVVNIITGGDALGPLISSHDDIDKISFTGSTATGKRVMESASKDLKRLTLELGGNDAAIVMPDANVAEVAEKLFWASFTNAGQVCIAAKRIYIHQDIYDELSAAIAEYARNVKVGDGAEQGTAIGPIQNKAQYERVLELIQDAKDKGYKFLVGGDHDAKVTGYFVPVTVLDNPPEDARIVSEEQFGPVMPLIKIASIDEAIARANASEYGLAGSVWTSNPEEGVKVAEQMQTGTIWINEYMHLSPFQPFGGHKQSGFGAELGEEGLSEFTYPQVINVKH